MPLLGVPHKMARAEIVTRADIFDAPSERLIAQGRIVVCLISLLGNYLEPTQSAAAASLILVGYAIFSAGLVVLTRHRFLNRTFQHIIHVVDVATACLLLLLAKGPASPFFVMFIFTLFAATLRWKWQGVVATAVTPALVLFVVSIINGFTAATAGGYLNTTPIFGGYLIVTGAMLAYIRALRERSHEQFDKLAHGPIIKDSTQTERTLAEILAHAALVLEAQRIIAVWEEREEPYIHWAYWREDRYQQGHEPPETFGNLVDQGFRNLAFLMPDARSKSVLLPNGPKQVKASAIDAALVARFSMRRVVTAAFTGASCTGRLFILDGSSSTDEHLLLTQIMAYRTGIRLDLLTLQRQIQAAAAIKERMRLTRDLHDGILQSLTAAGLHLGLVREPSDPVRFNEVKQLLAKEHRRIREFVDKTYPKSTLIKDVLLGNYLRRAMKDTCRCWDCKTSFSIVPDNLTVPHVLSDQLSLIFAEAIANAARHGGASKIEVAIVKANQHLDICIRDNGKGFGGPDSEEHAKPASIHERVGILGGSLDVTNSSKGVKLAIRIPMP